MKLSALPAMCSANDINKALVRFASVRKYLSLIWQTRVRIARIFSGSFGSSFMKSSALHVAVDSGRRMWAFDLSQKVIVCTYMDEWFPEMNHLNVSILIFYTHHHCNGSKPRAFDQDMSLAHNSRKSTTYQSITCSHGSVKPSDRITGIAHAPIASLRR